MKDGSQTFLRTCGYGDSPQALDDEGYGCFTRDYEGYEEVDVKSIRVCKCETDNCNAL